MQKVFSREFVLNNLYFDIVYNIVEYNIKYWGWLAPLALLGFTPMYSSGVAKISFWII